MQDGKVKWFNSNKGFGFIESKGSDYFVHFKEIQSVGYKSLNEGDLVTFDAGKSAKGAIATNVVVGRTLPQ